ncbi:MAG: HEAT repeat domain-containing protein [Limisphaerales bacterium]
MKLQSPHPDRDYWIAISLFAFCTFMFIMVNRTPNDGRHQLKFWLGYLASDKPGRRELAAVHLRQESRKVVPHLLRMVESSDTNLQAQAVLAFTAMDGHARPAIPELAKLLWNDTSSLAAARSLAGIGRASLPALTNALDSPVRYVRSNAARGIGLLHADARPAVPLLVNVLADRDETLRWAASRALGHIAAEPDQAVPALVYRLDDQSLEVRKMAIISLGKFHGRAKAAVPALRHKVLWGVNQDIRNAAVFALKEIVPTAPATSDMN